MAKAVISGSMSITYCRPMKVAIWTFSSASAAQRCRDIRTEHEPSIQFTSDDSMTSLANPRYRGIFPVVPTTFTESGELDLDSQKRAVDFMIDAGSDGLAILANFSEQFSLADDERDTLT